MSVIANGEDCVMNEYHVGDEGFWFKLYGQDYKNLWIHNLLLLNYSGNHESQNRSSTD